MKVHNDNLRNFDAWSGEVDTSKVQDLFKDLPNSKVFEPTEIFKSIDEVFNTEFWKRIKANYYATDVTRKEKIYRGCKFIKGYELNNKIYIHFKSPEGELLFNELDIHSSLDNGALNTITIINDIIVYVKVNAKNCKDNRDIYKQLGQTITKCYL